MFDSFLRIDIKIMVFIYNISNDWLMLAVRYNFKPLFWIILIKWQNKIILYCLWFFLFQLGSSSNLIFNTPWAEVIDPHFFNLICLDLDAVYLC